MDTTNENNGLKTSDPDRLSIVFGVVGTLGTVASISSLINQSRNSRELERDIRGDISTLYDAVGDMESSLALIEAQFSKLQVFIQLASSEISSYRPMTEPRHIEEARVEFGGLKLYLPGQQFKDFARTHVKIIAECKKLVDRTYKLT